jgi:hypothetical protein
LVFDLSHPKKSSKALATVHLFRLERLKTSGAMSFGLLLLTQEASQKRFPFPIETFVAAAKISPS